MLENITTDYTWADASFDIFFIVLISLLIWMILWWILKPSKKYVKKIITPSKLWYVATKQWASASASVNVSDSKKSDDLKIIEWIGPKIEKHLNAYGVHTFQDVISQDVSWLESILLEGGSKLRMHSPTTWPDQAGLARDAKWSELEEYQEILNGGRKK